MTTYLSGQNLGRYHILEQPGEGGMAAGYKAVDAVLQRNGRNTIDRDSCSRIRYYCIRCMRLTLGRV